MSNRTRRCLALLLALTLALTASALGCNRSTDSGGAVPTGAAAPDSYLFCLWNVENFFDDKLDNRKGPGDRDYDPWFANNPDILKKKLSKLTEALLRMNDGRGPDILAIVEVESIRAAELLKDALNASLKDEALHYKNVVMKEISSGRHIAPALITRLPVVRDRTRLLGKRQRILQTMVKVNGQELVVIAAHWASRIEKGSEIRRASYADAIYGAVRAMYESNDKVDALVCGDFNDTPEDDSVIKHLHATADRAAVLKKHEDGPLLYNLMADKDPKKYGTHYYSGHWLIFDQFVVSPGMLDNQGWSCEPDTVTTFKEGLIRAGDRLGRPWRFGSPSEKLPRGYSDHFPVTVRLKVAGR